MKMGLSDDYVPIDLFFVLKIIFTNLFAAMLQYNHSKGNDINKLKLNQKGKEL